MAEDVRFGGVGVEDAQFGEGQVVTLDGQAEPDAACFCRCPCKNCETMNSLSEQAWVDMAAIRGPI